MVIAPHRKRDIMGGSPTVRSVDRSFDLLSLFDQRHPMLPLRDIVELSGLPKTTVVRLLAVLRERGTVSENEAGVYTVGAALLSWVRTAETLWRVNASTRGVMDDLVREFGETVTVYVRQGHHRTPIALSEGIHTVRNAVALGSMLPLHRGAAALVLLSGAPQLVQEVLDDDPSVDADHLRRRLAQVEQEGYAESDGEREVGAAAIAAPVRGHSDRVIAALSISGPSSRFDSVRRAEARRALLQAATRLDEVGLGPVEGLL